MLYVPFHIWDVIHDNPSHWRTPSFFKMVRSTTNQIGIYVICLIFFLCIYFCRSRFFPELDRLLWSHRCWKLNLQARGVLDVYDPSVFPCWKGNPSLKKSTHKSSRTKTENHPEYSRIKNTFQNNVFKIQLEDPKISVSIVNPFFKRDFDQGSSRIWC